MKKVIAMLALFALTVIMVPTKSLAAGGIYASGGGTKTVGDTFTITVSASGAAFDTVDGKISVSGPVSISSFAPGSAAAWMSQPSNGGSFSGAVVLGKTVTSFTVATIKLKATGVGSGAVSVSGVLLQSSGSNVGSGAGSASFTIEKAPDLPGAVKASSPSHPDQATAYEATTISLAWTKDSGVDGFSYLLDQAEGTTPGTKADSADTSITYPDKAVGVYYFHIRAHKPDGWGGTTHFKINIKEPDAKIDATLSKPSDIKIEKDGAFVNSIKDGTVTGIAISGKTEPGFTANLTLTPVPTIPAGKTLTAIADESGNWRVLLDYPIVAGFHKISVQGQKLKVLTPISDETTFEIIQAKGGSINVLTDADANLPVVKAETTKQSFKIDRTLILYGALILLILGMVAVIFIYTRRKHKADKIMREITRK